MRNQRATHKQGNGKKLDPEMLGFDAEVFLTELLNRVFGQDRALEWVTRIYQAARMALRPQGRPLGTLLFLGPTGSGKTRAVEAAAEALFGRQDLLTRIDCPEFQQSHEIAKLVGSPPGYLGHRETTPLLTQESLDRSHNDGLKISVLLFDEIEKASYALWQMLLGVLDKATLTLGDNRRVDFSKTLIFMTSNLGAREMSDLVSTNGMGFHPPIKDNQGRNLDQSLYNVAIRSAQRKFSPEFMNRIDRTVVFRSLNEEHLSQVLDRELNDVQKRLLNTKNRIVLRYTNEAKRFLLMEGEDRKYGARALKRAIERFVVFPISNIIASEQVVIGDVVLIDHEPGNGKLSFTQESQNVLVRRN